MTEQNIRRPAEGVRVAVAQIAPALGDIEANLVRHRDAVARAREEGVDVLVFPELSLTGYRLEDAVPDVALTRAHERMAELAALSSEELSVVIGFVEEAREHAFFNAAAWYENGRNVYTHRKSYLPTYGMFEEQRYFARGKRLRAFDTRHGRSAILVCEDALHPTALTVVALDGAETVYVPSASPVRGVTAEGAADANARHWEGYLRAMARAFGLFIVYANRVGVEDGQTFWGGSEIIGPDGASLAKAAYHEEDFISVLLPAGAIRRRRIQSPLLRDEDLDLSINELERIRERVGHRPEAKRGEERQRDERPRDDHQRVDRSRDERPRDDRDRGRAGGGGGGGYRGRGSDREAPRSDRRAPWQQQRDDTRERRGRGPVARDDDNRGNRYSDDDRRPNRARPEPRAQAPSRYRPERGERRSRPLGGPFRPPAVPRKRDDDE